MKTQVAKWGNSLAIRIPKSVASGAKLKEGDDLDLDVEGPGAVKLRRSAKKFTLKDLVDSISADHVHDETDWAEPRGNET
jgi:antitoxin MazE